MRAAAFFRVVVCALAVGVWNAGPASAASCESLAQAAFPDASVTTAQVVPAGGGPAKDLPEHCRVAITLKPSADSDIKSEVWLPANGWNGKLLAVGNGGWNGNVDPNALASGLRRGYAVTGTDTGHQGGGGPWMTRPEKLTDFGYRAVHETTVKAKALTSSFYGSAPRRTYFQGCSAGGRQGMMSAQRYPEDFDGIVAGAPAVDTTGRATFAIWIAQQQHRSADSYIPTDKYAAIHEAVLKACDGLDGVTDGVLENPRACTFDPKVLECKAGGDANSCLTAAQVETARAMYKPAVNPRTGTALFPGLERGSELGWATFGGPQPLGLGAQMFQFMVFDNQAWDYKTLNFDDDMAKVAAIEQGRINVLAPDLSRFGARGGKLIHYHGWADQQIPAASSTRFFQAVESKGGRSTFNDYYRMFMVPGMGHCSGGPGTTSFDMLASLEQWVEHGKAPNAIPASKVANGQVVRTRPLCPYPQVAKYSGHGSSDDAANFSCVAP